MKKIQKVKEIKKIKEAKGITLVALVITIILLLILAGITISALSGDNGILKSATEAKDETEIAKGKEELIMYFSEEKIEVIGGQIDLNEYLNYIEDKGVPTKEEDGKSYAEVDGKIYEVTIDNGNLNVEYVKDGEITEENFETE